MPASRRLLPAALVVLVFIAGAVFLRYRTAGPTAPPVPARPIVAAMRAEPRSFNRFVAGDRSTWTLTMLVHARLVQLNQQTQDVEPALATKSGARPRRPHLHPHPPRDVAFSDGAPFTADDVVFTFDALYDPKTEGPLATRLRVEGKPLAVRKVDAHPVVVTLPAPYGPGLRSLNSLPILPAHKPRDALARGEFARRGPRRRHRPRSSASARM